MKVKKVPLRMCLGCNQSFPKKDLIRIVKSKENEISLDFTGKKHGRGAYICPKNECLKKAIKSKRLEKTFETAIPTEIYEQLEGEMKNFEG